MSNSQKLKLSRPAPRACWPGPAARSSTEPSTSSRWPTATLILAFGGTDAPVYLQAGNHDKGGGTQPEEETDAKGYSILDAFDRLDGAGLMVWCRYCAKWHVPGHGAGHRGEHCHKEDSPYLKTGYILRPVGKPVPIYRNGKPRPPEPSA